MSPRPGPRRRSVTIRLSDEEASALDQWAEQLGFHNHRDEPNRSAVAQWLTQPPNRGHIDKIVQRAQRKNGEQS
jgi:predicted transcriptional regulator